MLEREGFLRKAEWWLVVLIALHTYGIGLGLLVLPEWALRFGGWGTHSSALLPASGRRVSPGPGHRIPRRVLAVRSVSLLLTAKVCASSSRSGRRSWPWCRGS